MLLWVSRYVGVSANLLIGLDVLAIPGRDLCCAMGRACRGVALAADTQGANGVWWGSIWGRLSGRGGNTHKASQHTFALLQL